MTYSRAAGVAAAVALGIGLAAGVADGGQAGAAKAPTGGRTVPVDRASRDTWTPLMDVLKPARSPVTDAQLQRLRDLPLEAVWGALQRR